MFDFIYQIDDYILAFINSHLHSAFLDSFFCFITSLGNSGFIWITTGTFLFFIKKYRRYGIIILLSLLFSNILGDGILKPLVARIRPCNVNHDFVLLIHRPKGFSFPSGHTMSSFTAACSLYSMNKRCGIMAYLLAALIGFSRIYLFVHYPSDVITGAILGVITSLFVIRTFDTSFVDLQKEHSIS